MTYLLLDLLSVVLEAVEVVLEGGLDFVLRGGDVYPQDVLYHLCRVLQSGVQSVKQILEGHGLLFHFAVYL